VNPYLKKIPVKLNNEDLENLRKANQKLINAILPLNIFVYFFKGSGFTLVLTDSEVYILEIIGDKNVKASTAKCNLFLRTC